MPASWSSAKAFVAILSVFWLVLSSTTLHFHRQVFWQQDGSSNKELDHPVAVVDHDDPTASEATRPRRVAGKALLQGHSITWAKSTSAARADLRRTAANVATSSDRDPTTSPTVENLASFLDSILAKWHIHNDPTAQDLVKRIWNHKLDPHYKYDSNRDVLVFYHPLKTGGTSVSDILEQLGGVIPGSGRSNNFNFKRHRYGLQLDREAWCKQQRHFQKQSSSNTAPSGVFNETQWWEDRRVLFSHNNFRSCHRDATNNTTGVFSLLDKNLPSCKRVRHLTMIREPLALVASNWHEWYCRIAKWTNLATQQGRPFTHNLESTDDRGSKKGGCKGYYSLEELTKVRMDFNRKTCGNKTAAQLKKLSRHQRPKCLRYEQHGMDDAYLDDMPDCASVPSFLKSAGYKKTFHHHGTYAKCTVPVIEDNDNTIRDDKQRDVMAAYHRGALEFLSGMDTLDDHNQHRRSNDMIWVGVTERMHESMCVLHYLLQLPWPEQGTPRERIQSCRPTWYWTSDGDEIPRAFYQSEPLMVAVHQAANVVLDIQVAQMKDDLQQLLATKFDHNLSRLLQSMPHVQASCLE